MRELYGIRSITVHSAVDLVAVVVTVVHPVALVGLGNALSVGAGKGVRAALESRRLIGRIVHARLLIGLQLHAVRTAAHALRIRRRETEVTAVSIRIGLPAAEIRSCWG